MIKFQSYLKLRHPNLKWSANNKHRNTMSLRLVTIIQSHTHTHSFLNSTKFCTKFYLHLKVTGEKFVNESRGKTTNQKFAQKRGKEAAARA